MARTSIRSADARRCPSDSGVSGGPKRSPDARSTTRVIDPTGTPSASSRSASGTRGYALPASHDATVVALTPTFWPTSLRVWPDACRHSRRLMPSTMRIGSLVLRVAEVSLREPHACDMATDDAERSPHQDVSSLGLPAPSRPESGLRAVSDGEDRSIRETPYAGQGLPPRARDSPRAPARTAAAARSGLKRPVSPVTDKAPAARWLRSRSGEATQLVPSLYSSRS